MTNSATLVEDMALLLVDEEVDLDDRDAAVRGLATAGFRSSVINLLLDQAIDVARQELAEQAHFETSWNVGKVTA